MPREPQTSWPTKGVKQIAGYAPSDMLNGDGVRVSVFVAGCLFACQGCFNKSAQSFRGQLSYSPQFAAQVMADLAKPYIRGLSLLGGEPMLNTDICIPLARRVRAELPDKDIWCWTGYEIEWLQEYGSPDQKELLELLDVLVCGPYLHDLRDLNLRYRGSSNQRIIRKERKWN